MKSNIKMANRTAESEAFPSVILVDNCNACNLRCSMCDHKNMKKYRKVQIMPFDLYKKIIDEIAIENPTARVWEIFFGEPFMCRDIAKRIKYAKDKGLKDVVLNSNGVMLSERRARAVIKAGLDALYVGIDAYTEETYRKIRIGGDLSNAMGNVMQYKNLLKSYGSPDQKLFVQYVVSDTNEEEVEDFKRFWTQHGVNIKIRPKVSWAGLVEAANLCKNAEVTRKPCYWLMNTINICADGEVALCSVDVHCRVKCGNVKTHSIKEVWGGALKDYRAMHKEGRFEQLPPMCFGCSDWQSAYAHFISLENC